VSDYHAKGGRNATAALTPEERARRNRKAARTLGKEGRKARSAKGWDTRRKKASRCEVTAGCVFAPGHQGLCHVQDPADPNKWIGPVGDLRTPEERAAHVEHVLSAPIARVPVVNATLHTFSPEAKAAYGATPPEGTPILLKVEPPKPRRALPKAGTVNALVLAAMSIKPLTVEQIYERADDVFGEQRVRNALSSLRSGGHVVSEPKPGSAKEKLWRLA